MPRRRYHLRPTRAVRGRHDRPAGRPDVLPAGPRRRPRRERRPREDPGRGPRRAARRAARRARAARRPGRSRARPGRSRSARTLSRLDEPLNEAFRAGSLTLGWDGGAERVLLEARAQYEDGEPIDPDEDDDEDEDGPDLLRVRMTPDTAALVRRAGRPRRRRRPAAVPAVRRAARPAGPHLPSAQRPLRQLAAATVLDRASTLLALREGEIEIVGRIVGSSNNAMLVTVTRDVPGSRSRRRASTRSTSRRSASGRSTTSRTAR